MDIEVSPKHECVLEDLFIIMVFIGPQHKIYPHIWVPFNGVLIFNRMFKACATGAIVKDSTYNRLSDVRFPVWERCTRTTDDS